MTEDQVANLIVESYVRVTGTFSEDALVNGYLIVSSYVDLLEKGEYVDNLIGGFENKDLEFWKRVQRLME